VPGAVPNRPQPPSANPPAVPAPDAGVPRVGTADPNRFLIPREQTPPGFAERLDTPNDAPVEPRPASTVVLLREGPASGSPGADQPAGRGAPEVLLLRRHKRSGFAAGAWVFPGGIVDPQDRDAALPVLCDGPSPEAWARRLGMDDPAEAFAYVVAAVREAFEETGILLARADVGADPQRDAAEARHAVVAHRDALLAGTTSLREIAAEHALRYATDEMVYVAHWITPEPEPRRYDTRFFLAPLPAGQECVLHEPELVEARWLTAAEATAQFEAGELSMLPPTVHTLRRLAAFASLPELLAALRDEPVPVILPRMRQHVEGIEIEIVQ
jgi:8-oxo-dGTP pyrophosphatase MutT (NUDIX family)